jgi:RNA polymerase sigma-70 factor, ECF subfamily
VAVQRRRASLLRQACQSGCRIGSYYANRERQCRRRTPSVGQASTPDAVSATRRHPRQTVATSRHLTMARTQNECQINNLNPKVAGIEGAISIVMDAQNVAETWPTSKTTDQELVELSKRGDELAMTKLIQRHYGASLRVAQSILRNRPDSEDAVQTAYGRAFQYLHTFREEARFSTWITSIVVNQSLMHLRHQRRATLLSLDEPIHENALRCLTSRDPSPEESAAQREISNAIARALARLPMGLRMPYTLHAVSGLPVAEVADKLGLSLSATKSRIFRARCSLQSRLNFNYRLARCSA